MENPLLQGNRQIKPEDLVIYELIDLENGYWTFSLEVTADENEVFGRPLSDEETYVQAYVVYEETVGVHEIMDVIQTFSHDEQEFCYKLSPEVREALKRKMHAYCLERYGEGLPEDVNTPKPAPHPCVLYGSK